jgi:hypothetical protein
LNRTNIAFQISIAAAECRMLFPDPDGRPQTISHQWRSQSNGMGCLLNGFNSAKIIISVHIRLTLCVQRLNLGGDSFIQSSDAKTLQ